MANTYENFNGAVYAALCKPFREFCQITAPILNLRANHWADQKQLFSIYQEGLFFDHRVVVNHRQTKPIEFNHIWNDCNGSKLGFITTVETAIGRSLKKVELKSLGKLWAKIEKIVRSEIRVTNIAPNGVVKRSHNSIGAWQNGKEAIALKSQMLGQTASGKTKGHLMNSPMMFSFKAEKAKLKKKLDQGLINQSEYKADLVMLKQYRDDVVEYMSQNLEQIGKDALHKRNGSGVRVVDNVAGVSRENVAKARLGRGGYTDQFYSAMDEISTSYLQGLISEQEADQLRRNVGQKAISK